MGFAGLVGLAAEAVFEIDAEAIEDGIALGLGEDFFDDGFDAARAPLAALLYVVFGGAADDISREAGGGGLGESGGGVAEDGEGRGEAAREDGGACEEWFEGAPGEASGELGETDGAHGD
jgi:hypothetical protein